MLCMKSILLLHALSTNAYKCSSPLCHFYIYLYPQRRTLHLRLFHFQSPVRTDGDYSTNMQFIRFSGISTFMPHIFSQYIHIFWCFSNSHGVPIHSHVLNMHNIFKGNFLFALTWKSHVFIWQKYMYHGHKLRMNSFVLLICSLVLVKSWPWVKNLFPWHPFVLSF